jgi:hypothetical protein
LLSGYFPKSLTYYIVPKADVEGLVEFVEELRVAIEAKVEA